MGMSKSKSYFLALVIGLTGLVIIGLSIAGIEQLKSNNTVIETIAGIMILVGVALLFHKTLDNKPKKYNRRKH